MVKVPYKKRVIAYSIDILIAYIGSILIVTFAEFDITRRFINYFSFITLIAMFVLFIYLSICYLIFRGVSFGRLVANCRIVKEDGNDMRFFDCIVRALLQGCIPLLFFNILYQFFNKSQRSLYDYITQTKTILLVNKTEL